MATKKPLRALLIEDDPDDADLLVLALEREYHLTSRRVETERDMREALASATYDIVISDYTMPGFSGIDALAVLREIGLDLPCLIVSGTITEENAVEALRSGAHDFLNKGKLARLAPAVERELREAANRRERARAMRARDTFIADASHELRTPITALALQLDAALRLANAAPSGAIPHKLESKLEDARAQLERLTRLVNGLLDAATRPA